MKNLLKLWKKRRLLRKYKKTPYLWSEHIWLVTHFNWSAETIHFFNHTFDCELRCYKRLKKL
jgi:hypothetical protein